MKTLRRFMARLTASVLGRRDASRVREELAEHLTSLTDEYVRGGLPFDEARRRARLEMGSEEAITEAWRDEQRLRPLEDCWQDVRFAFKVLRRIPGLAAVAVLSIGLGIGANVAIFSIVNAVVLRALPYAEPDRLVGIWGTHVRTAGRGLLSPAAFLDLRSQTGTLERVEAVEFVTFNLVTGTAPLRVAGARASAGIFSLLGIGAARGRTFLQSEDGPASSPVAVLSYALWQRQFGSDPRAIGRSVTLNGIVHTIVGVVPPALQFPLSGPEVWVPFAMNPEERTVRHTSNVQVFGRLGPRVSATQAEAELTSMARAQEGHVPQYTDWKFTVIPLKEQMVSDVRQALMLLLVAAGLVLLIACANVGNLLVARAAARQQEVAMRIALGARRSRLVRQFLTESLVLATAGSFLGLAIAHAVVKALRGIVPATVLERSRGDFAIDGSVLMFSLALTVLATVVFGVGPAMRLSGAESAPSLGGSSRRLTGTQRDRRLRATLVVLETALALVLLIGAGLLINSFWRLQRVDPGFQANRLLTFRIALPEAEYRDKLVPVGDAFVWEGRQVPLFFDELLRRLAALPGVIGVAASGYAPLTGENNSASFEKERAGWMDGGRPRVAFFRPVSANYFRVLGIPLLRGRELDPHDIQGTMPVALINQTMANRYWPGEDPIGQRFRTSPQMPWRTIVGVMGDVRYDGLSEPTIPEMYFAYGQALWPQHTMTILVRTAVSPTESIAPIRREVNALDPNLPIYNVRTMDQWIAGSLATPRFNVVLLGTFAGLALVLASVGIYGVVSHSVTQRTRELGLRMAMGAQQRDVVAMVLRESLLVVAVGMAVGVAGALLGTRALSGLLYGIGPMDPGTWVAVTSLFFAVALLASYVPARRATRVDPVIALRAE
ncbi:MAG: ABC transporter permease [Acidobacteria bacterium]|nr:ABC transporter permease [Acidobacteriota bacterium]